MFRSEHIVPGGGGGGGSEQHVCKGILVISLSLSQAEQNLRSLTSQVPRQKKHSLTTCVKHVNFYLVRDYTKNMRSLTSQR